MRMLLATSNPGKLNLFGRAFAEHGFEVQAQETAGVREDAPTPEGNALLKARAVWQPGWFVFADDAGLQIDALSGEPGVQTRRWNGRFDDAADDDQWLQYLLRRLEGVPLEQRTARFTSGWALLGPGGEEGVRRLLTPFSIALEPVRAMKAGFPLSAVAVHRQSHDVTGQVQRELAAWGFFVDLCDLYSEGN